MSKLCEETSEIPMAIHTSFPATGMALNIFSNVVHVVHLSLYPHCFSVKSTAHLEVQEIIVKAMLISIKLILYFSSYIGTDC